MIPLDSLFQIIKLINIGAQEMREAEALPLIDRIVSYTDQRLLLLTDREIKEYSPYLLKKMRERLQEIVKCHLGGENVFNHSHGGVIHHSTLGNNKKYKKDSLLRTIDEIELNVALKLLSS